MKDEMGTDELGALFGCSAETIRGLTRKHVLAKVGKSYPVAESVQRAMANLRSTAGAAGRPVASGVAEQRARKLALECAKMERENAIADGKLIDAADMEAAYTSAMKYLRGGMLTIPNRLTGVDRRVKAEVDREIRAVLTDLASSRPVGGFTLRGGEGDT